MNEACFEMPDVLLKTVDMMVSANVPPKGRATAMREMTVATLFGKKPIPWSEPEEDFMSTWDHGIEGTGKEAGITWHES